MTIRFLAALVKPLYVAAAVMPLCAAVVVMSLYTAAMVMSLVSIATAVIVRVVVYFTRPEILQQGRRSPRAMWIGAIVFSLQAISVLGWEGAMLAVGFGCVAVLLSLLSSLADRNHPIQERVQH